MDGDTKELIEVVAGIKIPEEYRVMEEGESGMEKKFGRYNVCKALEDYRLEGEEEGRAKGMRQHLVQLVCKKLQKNKSAVTIAEELEEELPEIEKVIEAQRKVGNYDVGQICKAMGF